MDDLVKIDSSKPKLFLLLKKMLPKNQLSKSISRHLPLAISARRHIHTHPDLSNHEQKTAQFIFEQLRTLGLKPKYYINKTGVAARIVNGSGPTVALRADIDALPVTEETKLPFSSVNQGVMHACGHDMHAGILIGAAATLVDLKEYWQGTVAVMFQPAEESEPGGAVGMIAEGAFPADALAVFGLHVSTDYTAGTVGIKPGADYAAILPFEVRVSGKGGHGATPEKCIDPIRCAVDIIAALYALVPFDPSKNIPKQSVLTVGSVHAGKKHNVIPDTAVFCGTLRTLTDAQLAIVGKKLLTTAQKVARAHGCTVAFELPGSYPAGYNDPRLSARLLKTFEEYLGAEKVITRREPVFLAEDFSYYQKKTRGVYAHLGVKSSKKILTGDIHTATFNPDERAIATGMALHAGFVLDLLGS